MTTAISSPATRAAQEPIVAPTERTSEAQKAGPVSAAAPSGGYAIAHAFTIESSSQPGAAWRSGISQRSFTHISQRRIRQGRAPSAGSVRNASVTGSQYSTDRR